MLRANRHALPGHVWHITHRCHQQQFLLKFVRDRQLWRFWLFEACKRFGLSVRHSKAGPSSDERWSWSPAIGSRQFGAQFQG